MEVNGGPPVTLLDVHDPSQVGEARRHAIALARRHGFGEMASATVGIVASELASNLARHAVDGQLAMQWLPQGGGVVEIVSTDAGPGMADVGRCLQDGYSTGQTPGTGLGAVKRLASEFDIHSAPGLGTAIVARIGATASGPAVPSGPSWASHCRPAPGETDCGDTWRVRPRGACVQLLIADGLGHGPIAAKAGDATAASFDRHVDCRPEQILEKAHREIAGTRGAAAAIADVDPASGAIVFAGIGNIAASISSADTGKGMVSHNGTLGVQVRRIQSFDYVLPAGGGLLIMHSDGLQGRWSLDAHPGLRNRHPAVVAAVLARQYRRGHDDLTVLVLRVGATA